MMTSRPIAAALGVLACSTLANAFDHFYPAQPGKCGNTFVAKAALEGVSSSGCSTLGGVYDSANNRCQLDWCNQAGQGDGRYILASNGNCQRKKADAQIRQAGKCSFTKPYWWNTWDDCAVDVCSGTGATNGAWGFYAARTDTCPAGQKVGYGIVHNTKNECDAMGGRVNGSPAPTDMVRCHLDWCQRTDYSRDLVWAQHAVDCKEGTDYSFGPNTVTVRNNCHAKFKCGDDENYCVSFNNEPSTCQCDPEYCPLAPDGNQCSINNACACPLGQYKATASGESGTTCYVCVRCGPTQHPFIASGLQPVGIDYSPAAWTSCPSGANQCGVGTQSTPGSFQSSDVRFDQCKDPEYSQNCPENPCLAGTCFSNPSYPLALTNGAGNMGGYFFTCACPAWTRGIKCEESFGDIGDSCEEHSECKPGSFCGGPHYGCFAF